MKKSLFCLLIVSLSAVSLGQQDTQRQLTPDEKIKMLYAACIEVDIQRQDELRHANETVSALQKQLQDLRFDALDTKITLKVLTYRLRDRYGVKLTPRERVEEDDYRNTTMWETTTDILQEMFPATNRKPQRKTK